MMENCSGFKIIATYGVDGVLLSLQEPFEWGYGRTLEKAGSHSQAFLDLWWEMGLRLDFGMIYDVGIQFSSMLFLLFMVLLGQRTPLFVPLFSYFFHTLYLWTAAFVFHLMISSDDFLVRFSLSS
jgi:hypothetical protein